jgi:hypothetical protein
VSRNPFSARAQTAPIEQSSGAICLSRRPLKDDVCSHLRHLLSSNDSNETPLLKIDLRESSLSKEHVKVLARTLEGILPYERCKTLDVAITSAALDALGSAAPESVVLLSPACASYDQFVNFEMRGNAFRNLVNGLPAILAARRGEAR